MSGQLLWGFGDIVNSVSNAFSSVANWISDKMGSWLDFFITVLLKLVYEILKVFFMLLDFIQLVFRKMAGLDTVYMNGQAETGDLALMLFRNQNVVNALIALGVVAVVLLFMVTFVTIIRNHYRAKEAKDTAVGPVIGKAFKALFAFIFVPLVCYFGVYVSNGLLKTVDEATRMSGALTVSGEVFSASAMNANRARLDADFASKLAQDENLNYGGYFVDDQNLQYSTSKSAAEKIDKAFASKMSSPGANIVASEDDYAHMFHQSSPGAISNFDYMNTDLVHVYYDLQKFNWLFAFVSCFFIMATLLVAALGVIQRLYEITILFAISPPFIALMPMDDGKAFSNWTKKFVGSTLIMYGTVVALNFFFIIAPILQSIDLFGSPAEIATYGKLTCDLFNSIAHILFIMCGSLVIKDFTNLINELVAGEKVASLGDRGANVAKEVQGNMAKGLKTMDMTVGAAKRKIDDHFDPENVKKRQEAKAQKKEAKENKAAFKAGSKSLRESGKINRRTQFMMNRDYKREQKGKTGHLLTRSQEHVDNMKNIKGTKDKDGNLKDGFMKDWKDQHQITQANNSRMGKIFHPVKSSQRGQRRETSERARNDYFKTNATPLAKARKNLKRVKQHDSWESYDAMRAAGGSTSEAKDLRRQHIDIARQEVKNAKRVQPAKTRATEFFQNRQDKKQAKKSSKK